MKPSYPTSLVAAVDCTPGAAPTRSVRSGPARLRGIWRWPSCITNRTGSATRPAISTSPPGAAARTRTRSFWGRSRPTERPSSAQDDLAGAGDVVRAAQRDLGGASGPYATDRLAPVEAEIRIDRGDPASVRALLAPLLSARIRRRRSLPFGSPARACVTAIRGPPRGSFRAGPATTGAPIRCPCAWKPGCWPPWPHTAWGTPSVPRTRLSRSWRSPNRKVSGVCSRTAMHCSRDAGPAADAGRLTGAGSGTFLIPCASTAGDSERCW
jgi:hypothetical protein